MSFLHLKALHIIFVVTWFAGLFYVVRLFIYHTEAHESPEPDRSILIRHFLGAERRLWYGITWPSAVLTYVFGFALVDAGYDWTIPDWLWLKLGLVLLLTLYQLACHRLFSRLQKGRYLMSGNGLRVWNEVATLFLVAIVFVVVTKDLTNWIYGLIGLVLLGAMLMLAIRIYRRMREQKPV